MKKSLLAILLFTTTKLFAQSIGTEILSYHNGCTYPENFAGILIDTKIPFDQSIMHTIILEGYAYGTAENIDLKINFYLYNPGTGMYIYGPVVSTSGAYQPKIKIINKNGFISIFLEKGARSQYCINFKVRAWQTQSSQPTWYQNWTADKVATDPSIGLSSLFVGECVYKNNFSGNVGIGTTSPSRKLHIGTALPGQSSDQEADIVSSSGLIIGNGKMLSFDQNYHTHASIKYSTSIANESRMIFQGYYGHAFTTRGDIPRMVINGETGNIGIGTISPTLKLHVRNSSNAYIGVDRADNSVQSGVAYMTNGGINWYNFLQAGGNKLQWYNATAGDLMTMVPEGRIGIGTTTPQNKLEITGAINSSGLRFSNLKSTTTVSPSNNKALSVDANGDVILVNSGINDAILSSSNKTIVGIEKNMLFNAKSRFTVTQTGTAKLDENTIFDGAFTPSYTTVGIPTGDSTVVLIENLPNVHTQLGALIGWTTRYWWPIKFKIEGYNSYGTAGWVQIANISNNSNSEYFIKPPSGQYTKLRYTFYSAAGDQGKLGISELIYQHPEYVKAYDGLMVQYNETGKVGIGTNAPQQKLDVSGNLRVSGGLMRPDNAGFALQLGNGTNNIFGNTAFYDIVGTNQRMLITETGNVGIGTTIPKAKLDVNGTVAIGFESTLAYPANFKLAVDGNIIAEKVKVKNSNAWPDFVFKKDYQLPRLSDIEKYVNENSHLPEIPSAAEVEKDGQDLGEMNRLLLKKVEELTLYLIEQEKRIITLEKQNRK